MCLGWGDHSPRAWINARSVVEDLMEVVEHCRFVPGDRRAQGQPLGVGVCP